MKNLTLCRVFLGIAILLTLLFLGTNISFFNGLPTEKISAALNVLDDDKSGIAWHDEVTIKLGPTIDFSGDGVSINGSKVTINKGGNYIISGNLNNGSIIVDTTECVNLTFSNVNITNANGPALFISNAEKVYITLSANTTNHLIDTSTSDDETYASALFSNTPIVFQGTGTLDISCQLRAAITCNDTVTINDGKFHLTSDSNVIYATGSITINDGTILALSTSANRAALQTEGHFAINGGTLLSTTTSPTILNNSSTQHTVILDNIYANSLLYIEQNGKAILNFLPTANYKNVIFSSPLLTSGRQYDVYLGGKVAGGAYFYNLYNGSPYEKGLKTSTFKCDEITSKLHSFFS